MSTATMTVLYPSQSDGTFDLEYYLKVHMPLVLKLFGPHGMKGYKVTKLLATADGGQSPFTIQCILTFGAKDQISTALSSDGKPVIEDIPKFTNTQPTFIVGEVVGGSE